MIPDRLTHERAMTDGFLDFRDGREPRAFSVGAYSAGYRAARAIYARNPSRFLVGYKPRGIGPRKHATTTIHIVSEEFERDMRAADARAAARGNKR